MIVAAALLTSGCERKQETSSPSPSSSAQPEARPAASEAIGDAELASILETGEPLIRIERVAAYLARARTDQLDTIRHTFEHSPLDRGDPEWALLIEWWARFNPKPAYEYTVSGVIYGEHPRMRDVAVREWARQDPQDAIQSGYLYDIQALDGSLDPEMLDALISGWWDSGKPGLTEFISKLTLVADKTRATRIYARRLVLRDGARAALEEIPKLTEFPVDHRRLMLAGALTLVAHGDPKLAVEWLPIAESQGIDTRTFSMRIVGGWAHHDPRAATEWANQLPPGDERERALRRAAQDWQTMDPEAYFAWLDGQKIDPEFDILRYLSIRQRVYEAPREVEWPRMIELAKKIGSEQQRHAATTWCLQVWTHMVPDEAAAWLEAHPDILPDDMRAKIGQLNPGDAARIERVIKDRERAKAMPPLIPAPSY